MKRCALTLAAASLAIGASSSIPAHAGGTLDNAVYKAVKEGKETKKVKTYNGHEFNIKPVTVTPKSGLSGFVVKGQLSHHLSLRSDDQFYYTVEIDRSGTILKFDEKIDRGGLTKMVLKLPVGELVQSYSGNKVPSAVAEKGIEKAGRWLGGKLDGKWEGAARKVVIQIGMQVAKSYNLAPEVTSGRTSTTAKRRDSSNVRDHRVTRRDHRVNVRDHRTN